MSSPIRILLVEDQAEDAEILLWELQKGGLDFVSARVDTPAQLELALDDFAPDLVLADYSIPAFGPTGGMKALGIVRSRLPDVPLVFVSGTIGEERAIHALRLGVTDYVLKNNRARLVPAVKRALIEAAERRARIGAERERDASAGWFSLFMQNLPGAAYMIDLEGRYTYVNEGFAAAIGKPAIELVGCKISDALPQALAESVLAQHRAILASQASGRLVSEIRSPDGKRAFLIRRFPIPDETGATVLVGGIGIDMTDQIRAEEARAISEERFRSIAEATREWIWEMDREGNYTFCSPAAEAVTGHSPASLVGRNSVELIYRRAQQGVTRELQQAVAEKRGWSDFVLRLQHKSGVTRWVDSNAFPLFDAAGEVTGFRGAARDITERIEQEQRMARLSRIHAVLSEINSAIVRVSDRGDLFRDACRIAVEQGGFLMAWVGMVEGVASRVHPVAWHGRDDGYLAEVGRALGGALVDRGIAGMALRERRSVVVNDIGNDPQVAFRSEAINRGYRSMIAMPLIAEDTAVGVMVLYAADANFFTADELRLLDDLAADISFALGHIAKDERLAYVSYHDILTGLPNRQLFFERLGQLMHATRSEDDALAVLVIEVDRFGFINDSMGRSAGDQLLVEFSRRLRETFSDSATPARISGGRFAMAVEGLKGAALALHVEGGVLRTLAEPIRIGGVVLHVTAKVGIALYSQDGDEVERLVMNAEAAVQRAKDTAENVVFYAPELNARVAQRLQLETRLRQALDKRQFLLHYQPKVDLQTRRVVGVEALIRWLDPERGLVLPLDFIPLLEETGLIVEVGCWVIEQAVADLTAWRAEGLAPPRIAVNVSQAQVRQRNFVATVLGAIDGAKDVIDLEITESLLMAEGGTHIDKLRDLRAAGLRIHMDDFGTGYSSLGQIARLPLDTLKIDRAFITGMAEGNEHLAIVSMVIGLAKALKLQVVAEGVETEAQASLLQGLGCDQGQGWLFSRPLAAEALHALLFAAKPPGAAGAA